MLPSSIAAQILEIHRIRMQRWRPAVDDETVDGYLDLIAAASTEEKSQESTILNLRWSRLSLDGARCISQRCPDLASLDLSYSEKIGDDAIRVIAKGCPALERISLAACKLLTDKSVESLSLYCRRLLSLDIELCDKISDKGLQYASRKLALEALNIGGCRMITNVGIQLAASVSSRFRLRRLDMCGFSNITDFDIEDICSAFVALEHLELASCKRLTNAALLQIGKLCSLKKKRGEKPLRILNLAGCNRMTSPAIIKFLRGPAGDGLQRLELNGILCVGDAVLREAIDCSRHLRALSVLYCSVSENELALARQKATKCTIVA